MPEQMIEIGAMTDLVIMIDQETMREEGRTCNPEIIRIGRCLLQTRVCRMLLLIQLGCLPTTWEGCHPTIGEGCPPTTWEGCPPTTWEACRQTTMGNMGSVPPNQGWSGNMPGNAQNFQNAPNYGNTPYQGATPNAQYQDNYAPNMGGGNMPGENNQS